MSSHILAPVQKSAPLPYQWIGNQWLHGTYLHHHLTFTMKSLSKNLTLVNTYKVFSYTLTFSRTFKYNGQVTAFLG